MDLKREEKKKRNLLSKVNNSKSDILGCLFLGLFLAAIYAVRKITPIMAQWILMLEQETISTFFDFILLSLFLIPSLKNIKEDK